MPEIVYEPKKQESNLSSDEFHVAFHQRHSGREDTTFSGHNRLYNFDNGITVIVERRDNKDVSLTFPDDIGEGPWDKLREQTKKSIENQTGYDLIPVGTT